MIHRDNKNQRAAEIAYRMANIMSYKNKSDEAIVLYHRAIGLDPSYVPAYLELEALLKSLGRFDDCVSLYRAAAQNSPSETVFSSRLEALVHSSAHLREPAQPRLTQHITPRQHTAFRAHILLYADCSGINGAEQANHIIAMAFRQAGYRITFIQPQADHYLVQERIANGIDHVWIQEDDIYRTSSSSPSLWNEQEGEAVIAHAKPDLVLFCDGCPVSNLGAKRAARELGLPFMVLVHCVTREWSSLFSDHLSTLGMLYRSALDIIAVSQENLTLLRECFGLPSHMGRVIHNGVSPVFFQNRSDDVRGRIRQDLNIPDDAVVCLTVARMEPVKGYQFLIKAVRELQRRPAGRRLHYIWIGSGSMEPRIRAMIEQIGGVRNIALINSTSKVEQYLDASDIFVLPSLFEGMPVSIMEAMAKGLPVVATAVSGTIEELGTTGILLPDPKIDLEQTIIGLVNALELLAADNGTRERLGADCRRRAQLHFTRERMVSDYLELIEHCASVRCLPY